ncbi:MAG: TlpA family protein disulfide reductase [Acidobacteria bacterium]|nr:TlpA family protein disulfide reductase [Acidobacteriota bacterium]
MKAVSRWPVFALLCWLAVTVPAQSQLAPELELTDTQGRLIRLSDYRGSVVLLNFWATWCAPCLAEIPDLTKWQRDYRRQGLRIIGITYPPQELAEVRRFSRTHKLNYPVALGAQQTKELFTSDETLPFTIVIDRRGFIRATIQGTLYADEFAAQVIPLLSLRSGRKAGGSQK